MPQGYFSTLLPPPNLTGVLHLGHLWNAILQDTLFRLHEQQLGKGKCYWGFGLDHAGISLQIKVEEELRKEGKNKGDLSPEEFQAKLLEWKEKHEKIIIEQYKQLNFSLPLDEKRFTLDEGSLKVCEEVFERLVEDKLIYRAEKLVNWDTKLQTAISDAEVERRQSNNKLYTVKYFFTSKEYIPIATTRPETILGDTAVFVHPEDSRYSHLIGKKVKVPLTNRKVEVLADKSIDKEFGTGAMKCTPAHDFADYELGKKHNLEIIKVFDANQVMLIGDYSGKPKEEAKKLIIQDLEEKGFIEKTESHSSNVAYSERSGGLVEPTLSKQWFLRSKQLALETVKYWKKNLEDLTVNKDTKQNELVWMLENMEDWCISRQLEWGIPIYTNGNDASLKQKEGFAKTKDVLDTWFSSSLWPIIVFKDKPELYPISILISGKDILFFWIAKMIFMCFYASGYKQLPFKKVFLHGLVLDSQKRKMSKSLNNGIDPLELIKEYPIDAVRMFFLENTHVDNNIVFSKQKIDHYTRVLHKLQNAYEFAKQEIKQSTNLSPKREDNPQKISMIFEYENLRMSLSTQFDFYVKETIDFAIDVFCNRFLESHKLLSKKGLSDLGFLREMWNKIMFILEPIAPDFTKDKYLGQLSNLEMKELIPEVPLRMKEWWFLYLKAFEDIRVKLSIPKGQELDIYIFTQSPEDKEHKNWYIEWLGHINHKVKEFGIFQPDLNCKDSILFLVAGLGWIVRVNLNPDLVIKYRDFAKERKKWLKKEVAFLRERKQSFSPSTPQSVYLETEKKLSRLEPTLDFYNLFYPN